MKPEAKIKKQFEEVEKWLNNSRSLFTLEKVNSNYEAFMLLVAVEQMSNLLEMMQKQFLVNTKNEK